MGVKVIYRVQSAAQMVLIIVDDLHYLSVPETRDANAAGSERLISPQAAIDVLSSELPVLKAQSRHNLLLLGRKCLLLAVVTAPGILG